MSRLDLSTTIRSDPQNLEQQHIKRSTSNVTYRNRKIKTSLSSSSSSKINMTDLLRKSVLSSFMLSPPQRQRRSSNHSSYFKVVNLSPVVEEVFGKRKPHHHNNNKSSKKSYNRNQIVPPSSLSSSTEVSCSSSVCTTNTITTREEEEEEDDYFYYQDVQQQCPVVPIVAQKRHYDIIIVACGCFITPQLRFNKMDGIKRCIAGYTGGLVTDYPVSRRNLQDHTMALFIEYNTHKVTLEDILKMWHDNDDPWNDDEAESWEERSALFTTSDEQHEQCLKFVKKLAKTRPYDHLHVQVQRTTNRRPFYQAEEYLQDYLVKQSHAARQQIEAYQQGIVESGLFTILE